MGLFKREVKLSSMGDLALVILKAIRLIDTNWVLITGTTMCHIDENEKLIFYDAGNNIRKLANILKMKDVEADEFVDSIEKGRSIEILVEIKEFQPYDLEALTQMVPRFRSRHMAAASAAAVAPS